MRCGAGCAIFRERDSFAAEAVQLKLDGLLHRHAVRSVGLDFNRLDFLFADDLGDLYPAQSRQVRSRGLLCDY